MAEGPKSLRNLPGVTPLGRGGTRIQGRKGGEMRGEEKSGEERRGTVGQRKPHIIEAKIPPGPIKCLINSRRRIGRNNKHLSESFIA